MARELKQCPFEKACQCVMDEPCEYCETKCEYDLRKRRETIEVLGELIHEEEIEWPNRITTETISSAYEAVGRVLAKEE